MAPKTEKAREENRQVAVFLERLYKAGGFKSWGEFGREAGGVPGPTMSDWKRGENAPNGYNLLRLIWAAERRNEDALTHASLATDPLLARALRMARDMSRPLPAPPGEGETTDFDELVSGEWDEASQPGSAEVDWALPPPVAARLEELRVRVEETRLLVVEGLGLQDRARELEVELSNPPEDPPLTEEADRQR